MGSVYADDGSLRVTIVDGTTYTGRYSPDESIYVTPSTTAPDDVEGANHPCGALIVTTAPDNSTVGRYAPNGSLYIQTAPYTSSEAQRVTIVPPSNNGGPPQTQLIVPPLFENTNTFVQAFSTPVVHPNLIIVSPEFTNTSTFYPPAFGGGVVHTNSTLITNTNSFFSPTAAYIPAANPYTAKAVHFDGITRIHRTVFNAPHDDQNFAYSFWFKIAPTAPGELAIWSSDPVTNGSCWASFLKRSHYLETYWKDETTAKKQPAVSGTVQRNLFDSTWHHCLFAGRTNETSISADQRVCYIDDVKQTLVETNNGHGPFHLILDGNPFFIGDDNEGNFFVGDMADFWFSTQQNLITTGEDFNLSTRRLFIDDQGRPQDPSGFPPADILFSGDHTTFSNNQGTGGTFTVISGALTDASTHP